MLSSARNALLKGKRLFKSSVNLTKLRMPLARSYRHVIDMDEERKRQMVQIDFDNTNPIEATDRVYKPTYTIEFDRCGEVVLYTSTPLKTMQIYLKYPYVLYESMILPCLYMFYMDPFNIPYHWNYFFIFASVFACFPRVWYIRSLGQRVEKLSLLRGGKVLKVETSTIYADKKVCWVHTEEMRPIIKDFTKFDDRDTADFLDEEGQLKYELATEADDFVINGMNNENYNLFFLKEGTVHHPELFEAAVKGYNIDTRDYVINTANNRRTYEPSNNQ